MTDKTANYTTEMVDEMVATYKTGTNEAERTELVATLADKFGKSTRSIVAKLSRENVYIAKTAKVKATGKGFTKADVVKDIAKSLDVDVATVSGLDAATKDTLVAVAKAVSELRACASDFEIAKTN